MQVHPYWCLLERVGEEDECSPKHSSIGFVGSVCWRADEKGVCWVGGELLSGYSLVEHGHGVTLLCCFVLAAGRFLHALKWPDGSRY